MQHLDAGAQVAVKQRVLEDSLAHIGRVAPEPMMAPIAGPAWGYRHRARLSVRHVEKKGGVLVGFHERRSSFVADMRECHVVPRAVSDLLVSLRGLVGSLSIAKRLPQVELAIGDEGDDVVLVLRVLEPLTARDEASVLAFGREHDVRVWVQPAGPERLGSTRPTRWRMRCRSSASRSPSGPPTSRRSTRRSTACWWAAPSACWTSTGRIAWPTSSAASATSRCRSRAGRGR